MSIAFTAGASIDRFVRGSFRFSCLKFIFSAKLLYVCRYGKTVRNVIHDVVHHVYYTRISEAHGIGFLKHSPVAQLTL